jgi:hypothetical protein
MHAILLSGLFCRRMFFGNAGPTSAHHVVAVAMRGGTRVTGRVAASRQTLPETPLR